MAVASTSGTGATTAVASSSTAAPSPTLYVKNIEGKVKKPELRRQLLTLFSTYGRVLDIVATRAPSMRGQAFIVFENTSTSSAAKRALEGFPFYGKALQIDYSTGDKSKALLRRELGHDAVMEQDLERSKLTVSRRDDGARGEKRMFLQGEEEQEQNGNQAVEGEDAEAGERKRIKLGASSSTAVLQAKDVPASIQAHVLETLFQSHTGFLEVTVENQAKAEEGVEEASWTAEIHFESMENAQAAKEALHGVQLDPLYTLDLSLL